MRTKKRKSIYQRLTKKQQQHIRECYDGPPSRITIARIKASLKHMDDEGQGVVTCYECRAILRRVQI